MRALVVSTGIGARATTTVPLCIYTARVAAADEAKIAFSTLARTHLELSLMLYPPPPPR